MVMLKYMQLHDNKTDGSYLYVEISETLIKSSGGSKVQQRHLERDKPMINYHFYYSQISLFFTYYYY